MRAKLALLALAVLSAGATIAVVPGSSQSRHKGTTHCASKGSKTLLQNQYARVYEKDRGYETFLVYVCSFRTGNSIRLNPPDNSIRWAPTTPIALSGSFLAYRYSPQCDACTTTSTHLSVINWKTGEGVNGFSRAEDDGASVEAVVLKSNGSAAAIVRFLADVTTDPPTTVYRLVGGSEEAIDSGNTIDANSLGLSFDAKRIYWRKGGVPQSVPLN